MPDTREKDKSLMKMHAIILIALVIRLLECNHEFHCEDFHMV